MIRDHITAAGVVCLLSVANTFAQPLPQVDAPWSTPLREQLCRTYAGPETQARASSGAADCLDEVATAIGRRLSESGSSGVAVADLAALALLLSGTDSPTTPAASARPPDPGRPEAGGPVMRTVPPESEPLSDIGKGQEGYTQGVERLSELPLSERMVVTGDVTSGFQAASVSDGPELTSAFGRARVNFVTRAVPGSADGALSEGYFFVQMIAAGGAFDASPVGGPRALSPINDVATDRSDFNQGASRGNLYLKKAFYQQDVTLGEGRVTGRVGVISLSDLFDTSEFANNEARQFLNAAFVNSPAYKGGVGAPGFMLEYQRPVELPWVESVALRTGYGVTRTFRALTSPLWTTEVEARSTLRGRPGAYRVGATVGNVPESGGVHGLHVGFDQWLSDQLGVFGRYAQSNTGPGSRALGPVHRSYSLGTQWRLGDDLERQSAWGVGFSQAFPIRLDEALASERVVEAYFRRQFTENLSLTPDVQVVLGSGGQTERATHVVGSLRMTVGF